MNNIPSKPIPITLNCSGGISLGAYMAGVFYELTKEAVQDHPAIVIDIITGASAGAMSGTMAAFYLLNSQAKEEIKDFESTVFYQAWVKEADIKNIDKFEFPWKIFSNKQPKNWSVLSGEYLKSIADRFLSAKDVNITSQTRPLALIMTLTNLQGILKDTNLLNQNKNIKAVTSAETREFLFHSGLAQQTDQVEKMWDKVTKSGRASGAFPLAFPPIQDESNQDSVNLADCIPEYHQDNHPDLDTIRTKKNGRYHFNFSYTDGGVLDGLPLLKGIELVKSLLSNFNANSNPISKRTEDFKQHWENYYQQHPIEMKPEDRRYLYIQPQPVENIKDRKSLNQADFPMHNVAWKGLTLPKAEHESLRLQEIEEINNLVKIKQDFMEQYGENLPAESHQKLAEAMPYMTVTLNRIDPTIIRELEQTDNPELAEIYSALVNQGEFGKKISRASSDELLASEFFGAFGGFFDQRYREHDFLLGRISGLTWLHHHCDHVNTPIPTDELIEQIKGKIVEDEPKLKPSHWLRVFRIIPRLLRIMLIEAEVKFPWQLLLLLLKVVLIPLLLLLELLMTPIIYVIEAINF